MLDFVVTVLNVVRSFLLLTELLRARFKLA